MLYLSSWSFPAVSLPLSLWIKYTYLYLSLSPDCPAISILCLCSCLSLFLSLSPSLLTARVTASVRLHRCCLSPHEAAQQYQRFLHHLHGAASQGMLKPKDDILAQKEGISTHQGNQNKFAVKCVLNIHGYSFGLLTWQIHARTNIL